MTFSATDGVHMARALQLAAQGLYTAHPNPMVGCVIVAGDSVVGTGHHARAGEPHAEIHALAEAGERARGATVYVTLEPCAHHGRTPPCADALVAAGVRRVVAAMQDPFGEVAGRGLARLEDAGIAVETGLLAKQAAALNRGFVSRVSRGRPFVCLKVASSIDGAIAMQSGESQWITGPESRRDVQRLRARSGAILTGIGTVLADDPSLTVRDVDTGGRQPLRVVLDSRLRMPGEARMLTQPGTTLVVGAGTGDASRLEACGAEVRHFAGNGGQVDARRVLEDLAARGINEVLVEAGPGLSGSLVDAGLVDELVIYQAPHIMGSETRGMFRTPGWRSLEHRRALDIVDVRRVGNDTRITARISG